MRFSTLLAIGLLLPWGAVAQTQGPSAGGGSGITALTGDCTASGTGSVVITCSAIGSQTPGPVLGTDHVVTGTAGSGYIEFQPQSVTPSSPAANTYRQFSDSTGRFSWVGSNGFVRTLDSTSLTASRVFTLPDTTGTLELTGINNLPSGAMFRAGLGTGLNMNITTDQSITLTGPTSGNWLVIREVWTNCSASAGTATGAIYGSTSKSGGILVGSASTAGPSSTGLAGSKVYTGTANGGSASSTPIYTSSSQTVQFSLSTAQGSAVTCDIYVYGEVL